MYSRITVDPGRKNLRKRPLQILEMGLGQIGQKISGSWLPAGNFRTEFTRVRVRSQIPSFPDFNGPWFVIFKSFMEGESKQNCPFHQTIGAKWKKKL